MEWISVEQELPPKSEEDEDFSITVLITDGKLIGMGYHKYEFIADDPSEDLQYSSDVWFDQSSNLNTDVDGWPKVTQWMKLPNLPDRRIDNV